MSEHFCTYFDHRYAAKGLAMWKSLKQHCATATLHVLCLNDACREILAPLRLDDVHLHSLDVLEEADPALLRARGDRTLFEYYFTITPCLPLYLLKTHPDLARLTYLDADLFFVADPTPVLDEIGDHAVGIIEHRFSPDIADRMVYGRFNVGWLTFSNDAIALECLRTWRAQCLAWCHDRLEPGRFAEQKYLDEWPDRFPRVRIVQNRGANVAPWNLNGFDVSVRGGELTVSGDRMLFYHAHGFEPASPGRPRRLNLKEYNVEESPLLIESVFDPYESALISATSEIAVPLALALASDQSRETVFLLDTLKSRVAHLEQHLSANEDDRTAKAESINALQSQLSALRTQWSETEIDRVAKASYIEVLESQLAASEAGRAEQADALAAVRTQWSETEIDRVAKASHIEVLESQLAASEASRAEQADALAAVRTQWSETEIDRVAKASHIEVLESQLAASEADREEKAKTVQALQTQLAQSNSDRAAKTGAVLALETQLTAAHETLAETRRVLGETEAHLLALENSRSWRWTNPFRLMLAGVAKIVRGA